MTIVANQNSPLAIVLIDPATGLPYSAAGGSQGSLKTYSAGTPGTPFGVGANPFNLGSAINQDVYLVMLSGQGVPPTSYSFTVGLPGLTFSLDITNYDTIYVLFA